MTRLLQCTLSALILTSSIFAGGIHVATAKPVSADACKSCYEDCTKNHRGPICGMHCQSRMGCPASSGHTTINSQ